MKLVVFGLLVIAAMVMAAPTEDPKCSPWLGYCQVSDHCCRHLICAGYQAKCVPKGGLVHPGQDTRPLGPGPYPPNVPKELLID